MIPVKIVFYAHHIVINVKILLDFVRPVKIHQLIIEKILQQITVNANNILLFKLIPLIAVLNNVQHVKRIHLFAYLVKLMLIGNYLTLPFLS